MQPRTLSVVIPCHNEEATLGALLEQVAAADTSALELEIVLVDDCSTDGSVGIAEAFRENHPNVKIHRFSRNMGKGAALKAGFEQASGDIILIQDADLEYDPAEYPRLLAPILEKGADVVYGSRFVGGQSHRVLYFWHSVGNRFLTLMSNMFCDLNLTDMETCYKVFRREVVEAIDLKEDRFGFEPEFTAKVSKIRPALKIYEVGISYSGRTYQEGKKINWKDGVRAIYCIVKYNLTS